MADFITSIISSACLCGISIIIVKMCAKRQADEKYILITNSHYQALKTEKNYFDEQPLPDYSEIDTLIKAPTAPSLPPPSLL